MSLFLNLLFERDSYSNAYLPAKIGFDTAENEPSRPWYMGLTFDVLPCLDSFFTAKGNRLLEDL